MPTTPRLPQPRDRDRLRGLEPAQAQQLQRAMALLKAGDRSLAGLLLLDLVGRAPTHPEVLRCRGLCQLADGEWQQAAASLQRAHALRAFDVPMLLQLANAQDNADDHAGAMQTLAAAAAASTTAADWLAVALEHDREGDLDGAYAAVQRSLALDASAPVALLERARCATALGHAAQAADDCRVLIGRGLLLAQAWFMLADLKVVELADVERAALERVVVDPPPAMPAEERLYLQFALGKALEDAGRWDDALAALCRANALASAVRPWDGAAFQRRVDAIEAAFAAAPPPAQGQGREVIFLVGLPRSGTTLVEQIVSSHSQVEGASELPYLGRVIEQESRRRGRPLVEWAATASSDDWARLGREYLRISARWRARRPLATDKLPDNWLYVGAALRMLPGASVIDCRRDAVETCWSCFKQLFGPGMAHFSYSFEGLAGYWHAYDGLARFWASQHPGRFHVQGYESLVASPEAQIRALLDFCGLPFEPACLEFHTAKRAIRTPSALQVRQPLRRPSTPAAGYGGLLEPLRALLQNAPASSARG